MADRVVTIAVDQNRANIKAAYQQAITDLQGYQAKSNWTNAEAIEAIQRLSEIHEKLLKFLARHING